MGYNPAEIVEERNESCEVCESTADLIVHHKDGDQSNNSKDNFLVVCKPCHGKIHTRVSHGKRWDQYTELLPDSSIRAGHNSEPNKRTTVSIRPEQHEWVKRNNINLSEITREAIESARRNQDGVEVH